LLLPPPQHDEAAAGFGAGQHSLMIFSSFSGPGPLSRWRRAGRDGDLYQSTTACRLACSLSTVSTHSKKPTTQGNWRE